LKQKTHACHYPEAADELFFAKKVFFFSRSSFFNNIYRIPTQFPGGLNTKRTAQVIQTVIKNGERFSERTPQIFQERQNIIRTGRIFQG